MVNITATMPQHYRLSRRTYSRVSTFRRFGRVGGCCDLLWSFPFRKAQNVMDEWPGDDMVRRTDGST
jgi:hypothetical protein